MAKLKKLATGKPNHTEKGDGRGSPSLTRRTRGREHKEASFPVPPPKAELPAGYFAALNDIKSRIQQTRLKTALAANSAMLLLYWDIGRLILERQEKEGWGAKVIDRLSSDLRDAYPDMSGLSSRNLRYMRAFAAAWPEAAIVQRVVAQLPWRQNIALIERLDDLEKCDGRDNATGGTVLAFSTCLGRMLRFEFSFSVACGVSCGPDRRSVPTKSKIAGPSQSSPSLPQSSLNPKALRPFPGRRQARHPAPNILTIISRQRDVLGPAKNGLGERVEKTLLSVERKAEADVKIVEKIVCGAHRWGSRSPYVLQTVAGHLPTE